MKADWFFQSGGQIIGPLTDGAMREHVQEGRITQTTIIRKGDGDWRRASTVPALFQSEPESVPVLRRARRQRSTKEMLWAIETELSSIRIAVWIVAWFFIVSLVAAVLLWLLELGTVSGR